MRPPVPGSPGAGARSRPRRRPLRALASRPKARHPVQGAAPAIAARARPTPHSAGSQRDRERPRGRAKVLSGFRSLACAAARLRGCAGFVRLIPSPGGPPHHRRFALRLCSAFAFGRRRQLTSMVPAAKRAVSGPSPSATHSRQRTCSSNGYPQTGSTRSDKGPMLPTTSGFKRCQARKSVGSGPWPQRHSWRKLGESSTGEAQGGSRFAHAGLAQRTPYHAGTREWDSLRESPVGPP